MAGSILKQERLLLLAIPAAIIAYMTEHAIFEAGKTAALIAAILLIGLIVLISMRSPTTPKSSPPRSAIPMER